MRRLALLVLLSLAVLPTAALAQETHASVRALRYPGRNPNVEAPEVALNKMPAVDQKARAWLIAERKKVTIPLDTFHKKYLVGRYPQERINAILREARIRGYDKKGIFSENVEEFTSRELAKLIEEKEMDAAALKAHRGERQFTIQPGATLAYVSYGRGEVAANVPYRPDEAYLKTLNPIYRTADGKSLLVYRFRYVDPDTGNGFDFYVPPVCHNDAVETYTTRMTRYAPQPSRQEPQPAPAVGTPDCPNGIVLTLNAWAMESLPEDLRNKAGAYIDEAVRRNSDNASIAAAYQTDSISRGMSDDLMFRVRKRGPINADVRVQLLDPQTLRVVADLGIRPVERGEGQIRLSDDQREFIIQMIWPVFFSSPVVSGGARRLWAFPREWEGKPGGKKWCMKHAHGLYWEKDRP